MTQRKDVHPDSPAQCSEAPVRSKAQCSEAPVRSKAQSLDTNRTHIAHKSRDQAERPRARRSTTASRARRTRTKMSQVEQLRCAHVRPCSGAPLITVLCRTTLAKGSGGTEQRHNHTPKNVLSQRGYAYARVPCGLCVTSLV